MAFMLLLLAFCGAQRGCGNYFQFFLKFFEKTLKFPKVPPLPIQTSGNGSKKYSKIFVRNPKVPQSYDVTETERRNLSDFVTAFYQFSTSSFRPVFIGARQ